MKKCKHCDKELTGKQKVCCGSDECNKKQKLINQKRWRDNNPGKNYRRTILWQKSNPERHRETSKRWRIKNKEIISLKGKIWRAGNPEAYQRHKKNVAEKHAKRQAHWLGLNKEEQLKALEVASKHILKTIEEETEMKGNPKILINSPPSDKCCERCGKHVDELKAFGGKGDPLNGDFTGAKLIKTFRDNCGCIGASWECRDCIVKENRK